jgi:Tfp pilus assembly protein PilO
MRRHLLRLILVPHLVLSLMIFSIVLTLVLIAHLTLWAPSQQRLQATETRNGQLKSQLATLRARVDLAARANQTTAQLQDLDNRITAPTSQTELVAESSNFAARSNVQILHSDNTVQRGDDGTAWFQQDITVTGSYAAIRNLLRLLEGAQRLTLVQQVDWSTTRSGQQKARLTLATFVGEGI